MVLLIDIVIEDLKTFSSHLSSHPMDKPGQCGLEFDVIGSIKRFDEETVRPSSSSPLNLYLKKHSS